MNSFAKSLRYSLRFIGSEKPDDFIKKKGQGTKLPNKFINDIGDRYAYRGWDSRSCS